MQVHRVRAPVRYLDEAMQPRPLRKVLKENFEVARRYFPGYVRALSYIAFKRVLEQGYIASSRWVCFLQGVSLIYFYILQEQRTGKKLDHLHAHFAHDPTLVAYLVHRITGLPFSFTAHARDLYQVPEGALNDRIRQASAVITCCRANLEYLNRIAPTQQSKFSLIYHGVNLKEFQPAQPTGTGYVNECPLILSVGRLVEKKGFEDLLQALLLVKNKGQQFRCHIYGSGPLYQTLNEWITEHGLVADVVLQGDRLQTDLVPVFQSATLFLLTPFQTTDGDRDGIPNVLLEAMAVGLPVITTEVAGIPELVEHNQTGLLYQPHDVEGIASGIMELMSNDEKRKRLGETARRKVAEQFDIIQAASRLKALFA